jgi:hypothetical protein
MTEFKTNKFIPPPPPNMKITIGEDPMTFLQFYCKDRPNRFQRWMMRKLLGIKVEILK